VEKAAVELLICPHCGGELRENGVSLICSRGHTMNIARQGYVSLLGRDSGTHTADSAEMLAARERFLASGHFQPLVDALVEAAAGLNPGEASSGSDGGSVAGGTEIGGAVVDLGCGTGQYLAAALDALPDRIGIGVDNSKFAARRAAKSHRRASAIVADIWDEIPIRDDAAALMLNVFSPRNGEEMGRILAPGGRLVVVTPQAGHLAELIGRFGMISVDPEKEERLERSLGELAEGAESRNLEWTMKLGRDEVRDLVGMGPSSGRIGPEEMAAALEGLEEESEVTAAVTITTAAGQSRIT
jgi:23S rRNA (guanine745-N1)-methyltransferase